MLIQVFKNNLFFQNIASRLYALIPPSVEHNLAKYNALKKAFYQTALEKTVGSYLEFGVFTGSSFNFAMNINLKLKYLENSETEFFGFDSFQGFGEISKEDEHPFFIDNIFSVNKEKVLRNIKRKSKGQKYKIIEGFFEDSIRDKKLEDFTNAKARVILIDCDLKLPTSIALEFLRNSFQEGTIILFDEYNCYKGNVTKGEYSAFSEFRKSLSTFSFRRIFDYGYSGRAFIAYKNA